MPVSHRAIFAPKTVVSETSAAVAEAAFRVGSSGRSVIDDLGRPALKLVIRVEDRPIYTETGILDRLLEKIRKEHGDPPPAPEPEDAPNENSSHPDHIDG